MSSADQEKKNSKNKKDKFSKAIRNNLDQGGGDTFTSAGYHSADENSEAEKNQPRDKKGLSGQNSGADDRGMEGNRKDLRKIDQKALQAADFEYRDNSGRKKFILAALGLLAAVLIGFSIFTGDAPGPKLYLSDMPIDREQLAALPVEKLVFEPYRQIHLYFDAAGSLGSDRLYVNTDKVFRDGSGKVTGEEAFWSDEVPVKAEWRFFRTLFQEDFFTAGQEYKVSILDPGRKVLAQQYLTIK